jgi:hypothetical protein
LFLDGHIEAFPLGTVRGALRCAVRLALNARPEAGSVHLNTRGDHPFDA